jgi:tRNA uracil 4-sulfurtransferase
MEPALSENLLHDDIILARIGEISLKGLNRGAFERRLIENLKRRLKPLGKFIVHHSESRIWIEPQGKPENLPQLLQTITGVFGIVSASPVWRFTGGMEEILAQAALYVGDVLSDGRRRSFKIESRRGDKRFPLTSPEICELAGAALIDAYPALLHVDVHKPDLTLHVEIRDQVYLYSEIVKGQKGLPVGTGGRGMLLLSGGIDSPVAGYMMSSRGMELQAVYFHAYPLTSDRAKDKVIELGRQLSIYSGRLKLHVVHFTDIQLALRDNCLPELMTLVMRRMMIRIADRLAARNECQALITGESLGQVASQTVEAIQVTGEVTGLPVFRPLIGMDKEDTIAVARRIGTFETSILPFEDCCTLFVAKHPRIHPKLAEILAAEAGLDIDGLVEQGLSHIEEVDL